MINTYWWLTRLNWVSGLVDESFMHICGIALQELIRKMSQFEVLPAYEIQNTIDVSSSKHSLGYHFKLNDNVLKQNGN